MSDYLGYMQQISSEQSSRAKAQYLEYNFARFVKPGCSVLEIGPGLGEFLEFISKNSPSNIDIIDRDLSTLSSLKSRFKLNQVLQISAEEISSVQNQLSKYDMIFMLQIMEHIQTDALVPMLKTLYSCLNPGGHLLITVPNGGNPLGIVERYSDITHVNLFTSNSLKQLVRFADIEDANVSVQGYRIPALGPIGYLRTALQSALYFCYKIVLAINGGVHFSPLHPNITLVVTKKVA